MNKLKELILNNKRKWIIFFVVLFLGISVFAFLFNKHQSKEDIAEEVKQEIKQVDATSKTEVSKDIKADIISEVAKETGIEENTLVNATGVEKKEDVKLPENAKVEVISNVLVEKTADNKHTATIATAIENTTKVEKTVVPVAKPKEDKVIAGSAKTIVIVKDKDDKPVAESVVVATKIVDNKPTYTNVVPVEPKVLTEEEIKEVKKEEVEKTAVEEKVKEVIINEKVEEKMQETSSSIIPAIIAPKPASTTTATATQTTTVAPKKANWIESTQSYTEYETETYTDYETKTTTVYEPNYVDVEIKRDGVFYVNKAGVETFWYWQDAPSIPGISSEKDVTVFLKKNSINGNAYNKYVVTGTEKVRQGDKPVTKTEQVPVQKTRQKPVTKTRTIWTNDQTGEVRTTRP